MKRKKKAPTPTGAAVQIRDGARHPFGMLDWYVPLQKAEVSLYRQIREAVPAVDAAILKLIRLVGGFSAACPEEEVQRELNEFLRKVPTGWGQRGIQSFLDSYLD